MAPQIPSPHIMPPIAPIVTSPATSLSHAKLHQLVESMQTQLRNEGIEKGDVVTLCLGSSLDLIIVSEASSERLHATLFESRVSQAFMGTTALRYALQR